MGTTTAYCVCLSLVLILVVKILGRGGTSNKDWYPLVLETASSSWKTSKHTHTHTFSPLEGKPKDDDLLAIREALLPLLMVIPYDQLNGVHSLTAILTEAVKYKAEHGIAKFVRPSRLPLYDKNIADNATTVVRVRAEVAHKARLDDYASYEAAERGIAKFLRDVVDEIWYNDLKDADTFYTKVTAINIMALLDAKSGGLHAVDMISLRTNMTQYYVQADGIP